MKGQAAPPRWVMPAELEPYRRLIGETGGNDVEDLMTEWSAGADGVMFSNLPRYPIMQAVASQVGLLARLYAAGQLPEVPA